MSQHIHLNERNRSELNGAIHQYERDGETLNNSEDNEELLIGENISLNTDCGKNSVTILMLRTSETVHKKEKRRICMFCEKSFKRLRNLKQHENIHTGTKPHRYRKPRFY